MRLPNGVRLIHCAQYFIDERPTYFDEETSRYFYGVNKCIIVYLVVCGLELGNFSNTRNLVS